MTLQGRSSAGTVTWPLIGGADSFPMVSVVIATYRRRDMLCATLGHILKDSYPRYEVIVVDQTEEDIQLEDLIDGRPAGKEVRYFRLSPPNLSSARNLGIERSRGDIILFADDDIVPGPDWIRAHVRHYADPRIAAVAGGETVVADSKVDLSLRRARWKRLLFRVLVMWQDVLAALTGKPASGRIGKRIVAQFTQSGGILADWTVPGTALVDFGKGCNMSFRRSVFAEIGSFDPRCTGREEADVFLRLRRKGALVSYDSDAGVLHLKADAGGTWARLHDPVSHYRWLFYYESYFFLKNFSKLYLPFFLVRLMPEALRSLRSLGLGFVPVLVCGIAEAHHAVREHQRRDN